MIILAYYLLAVNLVAAVVCFVDKSLAKRKRWRIREKTLFVLSAIGGSMGMYLAMKLSRHKTKHKRFMIGIPLIIIFQILLLTILIHKGIIHM